VARRRPDHPRRAVTFAYWGKRQSVLLGLVRHQRDGIADALKALDGLLAAFDASQPPGVRRIK